MFKCNQAMRFWEKANKAGRMHCFVSIALPVICAIVPGWVISVWFTLLIDLLKAWIKVISIWFTLSIHLLKGWGSVLWFIRCILLEYVYN
jgi:hypothetical protein